MPILKIEIWCGEKTCASDPGVFCRFLGASHFGTRPECMLFPSAESASTRLYEKDGWVRRCKACLDNPFDRLDGQ
jgi:hypothetical protein